MAAFPVGFYADPSRHSHWSHQRPSSFRGPADSFLFVLESMEQQDLQAHEGYGIA